MIRLALLTSFAATAMALVGQVPTYTIRTVAGTTPPGDGGLAVNAVLIPPLGKVAVDSTGKCLLRGFRQSGAPGWQGRAADYGGRWRQWEHARDTSDHRRLRAGCR